MEAKKVNAPSEALLEPNNSYWDQVPGEDVQMTGTPVGNIPSGYIRGIMDPEKVGKVRLIHVKVAHNDTDIFFRIEWKDESKNTEISDVNTFFDAAGILFPLKGDAPISDMGAKDQPVNGWYWRADLEKPQNVTAAGLGTTQWTEKSFLSHKALYENGGWKLVFRRGLHVDDLPENTIQLNAGDVVKVGFAILEGSVGERGGVKSYSISWKDLKIEA